ncbi:ABC transporter permease [Jatrophihabitans sp. YIM 134969]
MPLGAIDATEEASATEIEDTGGTMGGAPDGGKDKVAGRSPTQLAWARLKRDKVGFTALVLVIVFTVAAILSPILRAAGVLDPYTFHPDLIKGFGSMPTGAFGGASWGHPFGVEPQTGRDVLSRVVLGIAFSLMISTGAIILSSVIGMAVGIVSGYMGGATDFWLGRIMDIVLSFPQLLMLLALSAVLKDRITSLGVPSGTPTDAVYLIFVLGFFGWPYLARIIRGQVLTMRSREFVEAAQSLGATRRRIWIKEMLPNLWAPLIVFVSLQLPLNIGAEAALSFLGVGLQSPTPSLGNILNDSVSYSTVDPAYFYLPGIVLVLVVLSFNLLGDGLRDALDPKSTR